MFDIGTRVKVWFMIIVIVMVVTRPSAMFDSVSRIANIRIQKFKSVRHFPKPNLP